MTVAVDLREHTHTHTKKCLFAEKSVEIWLNLAAVEVPHGRSLVQQERGPTKKAGHIYRSCHALEVVERAFVL